MQYDLPVGQIDDSFMNQTASPFDNLVSTPFNPQPRDTTCSRASGQHLRTSTTLYDYAKPCNLADELQLIQDQSEHPCLSYKRASLENECDSDEKQKHLSIEKRFELALIQTSA